MNKTETIRLTIKSDLIERVRELADKETRTISKQVEHLLKKALEKGEQNMKKEKTLKQKKVSDKKLNKIIRRKEKNGKGIYF